MFSAAHRTHSRRFWVVCILAMGVSIGACSGGEEGGAVVPQASDEPFEHGPSFDTAYCELVLVTLETPLPQAELWRTEKACDPSAWDTLDAAAVREETGAELAVAAGPRYLLVDRKTVVADGASRVFGAVSMRRVGAMPPTSIGILQAYEPREVPNDVTFTFGAGGQVTELLGPGGEGYVLHSYARDLDPALDAEAISDLASRLELPEGWKLETRLLGADLVVGGSDSVVSVRDELDNLYLRR